jgi:hypothetical protein
VISTAGNSTIFQKTRFWKEKSVEVMVTLGPTAQATLVFPKIQVKYVFNLDSKSFKN